MGETNRPVIELTLQKTKTVSIPINDENGELLKSIDFNPSDQAVQLKYSKVRNIVFAKLEKIASTNVLTPEHEEAIKKINSDLVTAKEFETLNNALQAEQKSRELLIAMIDEAKPLIDEAFGDGIATALLGDSYDVDFFIHSMDVIDYCFGNSGEEYSSKRDKIEQLKKEMRMNREQRRAKK